MDYLEFEDSGTQMGRLCGSDLPGNVYSSGNVLSVKFHTNNKDTFTGFKLQWLAVSGVDQPSLIIKESALDRGSNYKLIGSITTEGSGNGSAVYSFSTAVAPFGGNCNVNPIAGYALRTEFMVSCQGWNANGRGVGEPATDDRLYFRIHLTSNKVTYGRDFFQSTDPVMDSLRLPSGPSETDPIWELLVEIVNEYKEFNTTKIAVQMLQDKSEEGLLESALEIIRAPDIVNDSYVNHKAMAVVKAVSLTINMESDGEGNSLRTEMCKVIESSASLLTHEESVYQISSAIEMVARVPSQLTRNAQARDLTNTIVRSLTNLSSGVLRRMLPGEQPVNISTDGISMLLERTTMEGMAYKTIQLQSGRFSLPSAETMFGDDNYDTVDLKVVDYKRNPFTWDKTSNVRERVISVEIYDDNFNIIAQQNISDDFIFSIDYSKYPKTSTHTSSTEVPAVSTSDEITSVIAMFNVTSHASAVRMYISTSEYSTSTFMIDTKYGEVPEMDHFDFRMIVPGDTVINEEKILTSEGENSNTISTINTPARIIRQDENYEQIAPNTKTYEVFIPTQFTGTYYVQISEFNGLDKPEHSILNRPRQPFTLKIHTATCKYWNEHQERWTPDGCKVDPLSTPEETICYCNHLTNFGVESFYVPINKIDWDVAFANFARLHENPVVFVTICIIIVWYIVLLVFCRRKDKNDRLNWNTTALVGNRSGDHVQYHVTVYTGFTLESGTRSNIYFKLSGEKADSGIRHLKDVFGKLFTSGSVNHFLLTVPKKLGELQYLYIWHDSSGLGDDASWFLNRIVVTDRQNGECFYFLCNQWLAVDKGDGKIDRILTVAAKNGTLDFKNRFDALKRQGLSEDHLWVSLFLRPKRSSFTRVQRLSCCLSMLLAYLISNAMFYKTDSEAEKMNFTWIHFGPIKFSLQQIYIGTISTLVVFPVNMLTVYIFRNTRRTGNRLTIFHKFFNLLKFWKSSSRYSKDDGSSDMTRIEKKNGLMLPYWCLYIAYSIIFLVTLISGFFVIMYSMQWGPEKSSDWLFSCLTSFCESLFLIEPIKVLVLAYLFALMIRNPESTQELQRNKVILKDEDYESFDKVPLNTEEDSPYKPLTSDELKPIKIRRVREKQMMSVFYGIVVYVVFVGLSIILCRYVRDPMTYYLNTHLEDTFIKPHSRFNETEQFECELIGHLETLDFDVGWQSDKPDTNHTNTASPWKHQNSTTVSGIPAWGRYGYYDTNGYVATFPREISELRKLTQSLREEIWIDRFTSVALVEFDLYNPDSKLFASVTYMVEFLGPGGAECMSLQSSFRLLHSVFGENMSYDNYAITVFICWVLRFALGIGLFVSLVRMLIKQRLSFFKLTWNIFDLILVATTFASLTFMVVFEFTTSQIVTDIIKKNDMRKIEKDTTIDKHFAKINEKLDKIEDLLQNFHSI
ncbi:polycystin-1-like protein 2 [Glandiceps talaboti]